MSAKCLIIVALLFAASLVNAAEKPHGTRTASEIEEHRKNTKHQLRDPIPQVLELGARYFDQYVSPKRNQQRSRYWLVVFYAAWCHACDEVIEPLTKLADETLSPGKTDVPQRKLFAIAKHDVTEDEGVAMRYQVEGYPTILLLDKNDSSKQTKYEGKITFEGLLKFLKENTEGLTLPE